VVPRISKIWSTEMTAARRISFVVLVGLVGLVGHLAWPSSSWAGPAERATADADASARDHFQRGQKLSVAGDYAAAYREFAAGYALTERPLFLFNMAEAARASGDLAKARDNYTQFLQKDPKNPLAATAQSRISEIDRGVAAPLLGPSPAPASPAPAVTGSPPPRDPVLLPAPVTGSPSSIAPRGDRLPMGPVAIASSATEPTPIYKKWPFWAVVGGVAASGLFVYAVSRDSPVCGAGCSQLNFR
jgi:hypothetical protein